MNPSELETRVFACAAWLPLPVAAPLRAAEVAPHEPAERLEHLAHAAEALVQLLGSVVLLDAAAERQPLTALHEGRTHAALGLWRSILEQTTRNLKNPTLMELRALIKDRTLGPRFMESVGRLLQVRNELSHPIRRVSAEAARRHIPVLLAGLDAALLSLHFLDRYALVRLERRDEARPGYVWLRPLVGPEALRAPVMLRWPDSPPLHEVVLVSAEPRARWLTLSPLYRVGDDRALLAYGRVHDGRVEHYDVREPDAVWPVPVDRPDWLRGCLTADPPRQGRSDLGAEGLRLANLDATAAFDTSGPRAALASASIPSMAPVSLAPGGPPRKLPIWAIIAAGLVVLAGSVWWRMVERGAAPDATAAAPGVAADQPAAHPGGRAALGATGAPQTDRADGADGALPTSDPRRRPTATPLNAANDGPPEALLTAMTDAYDRADLGTFESAYLDRLNCFYGALPSPLTNHTDKHLLGTAVGTNWRRAEHVKLLARRPYGDGTVEEALVCHRTRDTPRSGGPAKPSGVRYFGVRQTPSGWRIFAEAGPMRGGDDSACTDWLLQRFAGARWSIDEPEALSSFGDTPCGSTEPPANTRR